MSVQSFITLLSESGNPYLAADRSYAVDGRLVYSTPAAIEEFVRMHLRIQDCAEEYLYVLCFDSRNHLIGLFEASHGTVAYSLVSNREILQKALLIGAVSITLTHNHPGNDPTPSEQDIQTTNSLTEACGIIGIGIMDHIVISRSG